MSTVVRKHVVVIGLVQGVFFRAETARMAESMRLAGWVRNLPDGSVEAVFEGAAGPVDEAVAWCARGPSRAMVTSVRATDEPPEGLTGFRVLH